MRTTFGRRNHPWEAKWRVGGENVVSYRLNKATVDAWNAALESSQPALEADPAGTPEADSVCLNPLGWSYSGVVDVVVLRLSRS